MLKQYFIVAFILCTLEVIPMGQNAYSQPQMLWKKTYGGINGDYGKFGKQTRDKGYIIAGNTLTYGAGGFDFWLIKTDSLGNELWNKTFGGSEDDYCETAQITSDGGFIIVGYTESFGAGGKDLWLIKTDSTGGTDWAKTFGGSSGDHGYSVQQTSDNGFIVTGTTVSYGAGSWDAWLIKTDSSGDTVWTKTIGQDKWDEGRFVGQTADGGYIITGQSNSYGEINRGVWLIKTDDAGNEEWNKIIHSGGLSHTGRSVQQTTDGGYIIGAEIWDTSVVNINMALIKTNSNGDLSWINVYGGYDEDSGYSAKQTLDGGYIITGTSGSFGGGGYDLWLIKTDPSGKVQWDIFIAESGADIGRSVEQSPDGGYVVAGITESSGAGSYDAWLICFSPDTEVGIESKVSNSPISFSLNQNFPNPFNQSTNIQFSMSKPSFVTLKVYDLLGNEIDTLVHGNRQAGAHEIKWTAKDLPSGIFFYRLRVGEFVQTKKLILQK